MTGLEILDAYNELNSKLITALSTMEKKDTIHDIRLKINNLQNLCSHNDPTLNYDFIGGRCPYCNKQIIINEDSRWQ